MIRSMASTDDLSSARVVCDSIAPSGVRLTTIVETHPAIIHQDLLTHRTMYRLDNREKGSEGEGEGDGIEVDSSKSTTSNRARTTRQIVREVLSVPFCPVRFPARAATMHSSKGYLTGWKHHVARHAWLKSRYVMVAVALFLQWMGVHKQIANRLLQPWQWVTMVMTATDTYWFLFFRLRQHYAAQDEVQTIAEIIHLAYDKSTPKRLIEGDWHLPFITPSDRARWDETKCIKLSVARCARQSYRGVDVYDYASEFAPAKDVELHDRLVVQIPEHAGPREHQAMALSDPTHRSGNLWGWEQLRHSDLGEMMKIAELTKPIPKPKLPLHS